MLGYWELTPEPFLFLKEWSMLLHKSSQGNHVPGRPWEDNAIVPRDLSKWVWTGDWTCFPVGWLRGLFIYFFHLLNIYNYLVNVCLSIHSTQCSLWNEHRPLSMTWHARVFVVCFPPHSSIPEWALKPSEMHGLGGCPMSLPCQSNVTL